MFYYINQYHLFFGAITNNYRQKVVNIDLETVKSHIRNTYHKLDVNSRAEAIKIAKQNRLI